MKNKRSSTLDEDAINRLIEEESNKKSSKKITDILCGLMDYFTFIPAIVYNLYFFFLLKRLFEKININGMIGTEDYINDNNCFSLYNWAENIFSWTVISLVKSFMFIMCAKLCCGGENDVTIFCMLIKAVTSFIPSVFFVIKLSGLIEGYEKLREIGINDKILPYCDPISTAVESYYQFEYLYIVCISCLVCFVPFGAFCMGLKEIWKSRGYTKDE
jgi:hypothetical protein